MLKRVTLTICFFIFITGIVHAGVIDSIAKFTVAKVLQSNMVVQQNKPFRVWGTAAAGDIIELQADWTTKITRIKAGPDGKWLGEITVPAAVKGSFKPHTILVKHKARTEKFDNLLIGDVWFASGQSNMEMRMAAVPGWGTGVKDFEKELPLANFPHIRLYKVEMGIEFQPQEEIKGSEWEVCTPKSAAGFSGVGYYFARELFNRLQIPIGVVGAAIPATAMQNFTDINVLLGDSVLKRKYVDPYVRAVDSIKAKNDKRTTLASLNYPGLVYNKMIYPLRNLSIKGFIWYQGESNNEDGKLYTRLTAASLAGWRRDFGQGDLPYYFVQMTPYKWGKNDSTLNWYAKFREAQEDILKIKKTGMAVTMDVGEPDNIHPLNKKDVGIRLAKVALHETYKQNIVWCGPHYKAFKVEGSTVKVFFDKKTIGEGIKTIDSKPPKHFYIAGADKKFYKADARLSGNAVILTAPQVKLPVAVRYAFINAPVTNLAGSTGLPAVPFRTDNWDN
ncbi:sialate O-acetylesterase [Mucilaginibacter hurinus]|uniref:Sialate O-acetylesterase n=1 Tax=Mucilaginibacter hurinus TaxID=2201324 RepID=A0A367GMT6_9SPHI|nr:sialate O-acetylesterase [Mucilaginibacter hurinus]RCH54345.1 sialate O-acetylesterase [Mucilaginibacter hurinus]